MKKLAFAVIAIVGLNAGFALADQPAPKRTTSSERDAAFRYLNPQLYGRDQPLTVEGRTQAAGMDAWGVVDVLRRWSAEEEALLKAGKYTKSQWKQQDAAITDMIERALKTIGRDPASLVREIEGNQIKAEEKIKKMESTAKQGRLEDLEAVSEAMRDGLSAERQCQLLGACDPKHDAAQAAFELMLNWLEGFSKTCQQQKKQFDLTTILGFERQMQLMGMTGKIDPSRKDVTDAERAESKRQNDISERIRACKIPVWKASVAGDMPQFEREFWMMRCGNTPFGRWLIMPSQPGALVRHKGELTLDQTSRKGTYWLEATEKGERGFFRETGWAEIKQDKDIPTYNIITLHSTWSSRTSDGKGGYAPLPLPGGDMTFGVTMTRSFCSVDTLG
jgi:hypothetical protein